MDIWKLVSTILDDPDLQEQLAGPIADALRKQLPPAADKMVADFLARIAADLQKSVPVV